MVQEKSRAVVTVVTQDYAHYAVVLGESVRRHDPDTDFLICFLDAIPDEIRDGEFGRNSFRGEDLGLANWKRFAFQYTPFELSCAVKPFVINHALNQGYQRVMYLDSDFELFGRLDAIWAELDANSVLLTPHLSSRAEGAIPGYEGIIHFSRAGFFNAGFIGVSNSPSGRKFTDWWARLLATHCIVNFSDGIFVDQKWLDCVPSLFPEAKILDHPGCNFGHWFMSNFSIVETNTAPESSSNVTVGGYPIVLMHFSQLTPDKPTGYLRFQSEFRLGDCPRLEALVLAYHRKLENAGSELFSRTQSGLHRLASGVLIHRSWREAIRRNEPDWLGVQDPFRLDEVADWKRTARRYAKQSRRWRKDWRLNWARTHGIRGLFNAWLNRVKEYLRSL